MMKAILVCVDFADLLEITLPRNRHHFKEFVIVTTPTDEATINLAKKYDCIIHKTESFYDDGAHFNKYKALEEGLDLIRSDWICTMDADIIWPKELPKLELQVGNLYCPRRRLMLYISKNIPPEERWVTFQLNFPGDMHELPGYTQIFHADDEILGEPPWYEIDWVHAGGADSFFQLKWPSYRKKRLPFEVLHLGPTGINWCGRCSTYIDGSQHPESKQRHLNICRILDERPLHPGDFSKEKVNVF